MSTGPPPRQPPTGPPSSMVRYHGGATAALVTGILGIVLVPGLGVVAWILGHLALSEIDADPQAWSNRDHAVVGRILGIVGTVLVAALVLFFGLIALISLATFLGVVSSM